MTLKIKDPPTIVQSFKAQIVQEQIVFPITIADYLRKLYLSNDQSIKPLVIYGPRQENAVISSNEIAFAIKKLKRAATGPDQLASATLKR